MLKHTSVGSSTPQVRNPSGLRKCKPSTDYSELLKTLPFPTSQLVRETSQAILEKHQFYAWKRPAHLRPHWLILSDKSPCILIDSRNGTVWSLKFPYDTRQVQKVGPIICEAAYDSQEATLWIWDVLVWEKGDVWSSLPYSRRWDILQTQIRPLIQENNPMCDITIKYPEWTSIKGLSEPDVGYSVEFQPEKSGNRRFVWVFPKKADTFHPANFHERKMVSEAIEKPKRHFEKIVETPTLFVQPAQPVQPVQPVQPTHSKKYTVGIVKKDKLSKLPDTYTITSESGEDLGLAAIRSMEMSVALRMRFMKEAELKVELQWYESFQKYEVVIIC